MNNFKRGDTVVYIGESSKFFTRGNEYVVSHIDDDYDLWVKQDNMGNYFYSAVCNFKLKEKTMNKMPELKAGMILETSNGKRYLLIRPKISGSELYGLFSFSPKTSWDSSVTMDFEEFIAITNVAKIWDNNHTGYIILTDSDIKSRKLLWQRTTPEQEKIAELEETINKAKSTIEEAVEQINQLKEA